MIKRLTKMTENQINAVKLLERECNIYDEINLSTPLNNEMNVDKSIRSFFLMYEEGKLISFIGLFIPSSDEAEATAYTSPSYRKRGHFTTLLHAVKIELRSHGIKRLLLVSNPCITALSIATYKQLAVDQVEYLMEYLPDFLNGGISKTYLHPVTNNTFSDVTKQNVLELLPVEPSDKDVVVTIACTYFNGTPEDEAGWFDHVTSSEDSFMYKAVIDNRIIGSVCINYVEDTAFIFGLGLAPAERGKGYGKALLKATLELIRNNHVHKVKLEVSSKNQTALLMYQKYGFQVKAQVGYYAFPIE